MVKNFLKIFISLLAGIIGGIIGYFLIPYLSHTPLADKLNFSSSPTIINQTKKIIITENTGIQEVIDKVSLSTVGVITFYRNKILSRNTGFILTSDGLVLTSYNKLNKKPEYKVIDEKGIYNAKVLKVDKKNSLVLLKIEKDNLPVVSLGDINSIKLGERIILIGKEVKIKKIDKNSYSLYSIANVGTVRKITESLLFINLTKENSIISGGPLVNIKGEVIGMNLVDENGNTKAVPTEVIREFVNL